MAIAMLRAGKHVLCEKPLARTPFEAAEMVSVARATRAQLKCGFNLRYHPGIKQALAWTRQQSIGEIDVLRCVYGIPGRPGYEEEWRTNPEVSGGGELVDQGIHVLDLFRLLLGQFETASGMLATRFWSIAPTEDNAFALLQTATGQVATLHVSWTQWKPLFRLEIVGHDGYISVEGLGGAYGIERVCRGSRTHAGPIIEETHEFRGADLSWTEEWADFVSAIESRSPHLDDGSDGYEALKLVAALYDSARTGCLVDLSSPRAQAATGDERRR
jgi:predicted dehydrogenase